MDDKKESAEKEEVDQKKKEQVKQEKKPKKSKKELRMEKILANAKEVNASEILKESDKDQLKPKFVSNLKTKFYEPNGIAKSKHNINSLAYDLQQNEQRLEQQRVNYSLKKKDARDKYGW